MNKRIISALECDYIRSGKFQVWFNNKPSIGFDNLEHATTYIDAMMLSTHPASEFVLYASDIDTAQVELIARYLRPIP